MYRSAARNFSFLWHATAQSQRTPLSVNRPRTADDAHSPAPRHQPDGRSSRPGRASQPPFRRSILASPSAVQEGEGAEQSAPPPGALQGSTVGIVSSTGCLLHAPLNERFSPPAIPDAGTCAPCSPVTTDTASHARHADCGDGGEPSPPSDRTRTHRHTPLRAVPQSKLAQGGTTL
jgi:hypothetical protein